MTTKLFYVLPGFARITLQKTKSPTLMSGRFFFVAPSNARYESDAGSEELMSTQKKSIVFDCTIPTTESFFAGKYRF